MRFAAWMLVVMLAGCRAAAVEPPAATPPARIADPSVGARKPGLPETDLILVGRWDLPDRQTLEGILDPSGRPIPSYHWPGLKLRTKVDGRDVEVSVAVDRHGMSVTHVPGAKPHSEYASLPVRIEGPGLEPLEREVRQENGVFYLGTIEATGGRLESFEGPRADSALLGKPAAPRHPKPFSWPAGGRPFEEAARTMFGYAEVKALAVPSEVDVERGRASFMDEDRGRCFYCHGERLDMTWGEGRPIVPPSRVLRDPAAYRYGADARGLFRTIKYGVPGTAMSAFGGKLADDEIWDIAAFVVAERARYASLRPPGEGHE